MQFNYLIIFLSLSLVLSAYANSDADVERLNQADKECQTAQTASMFKALKLARSCIGTYESVADQDPQNKRALVSAIRFHLQAPAIAGGSEDKAEHYLDKLKKIDAEQSQFIWLQFLLDNDRQPEAIKIAKALDATEIKHLVTHYFVARAYRQEKDYVKAITHLETLQTFSQNSKPQEQWFLIDSNLQIGEIYLLQKKDPQLAIEKFLVYQNKMKDTKDKHYLWGLWSLAKAYKAANELESYKKMIAIIKSENYKKNKPFKKEFEAGIKK